MIAWEVSSALDVLVYVELFPERRAKRSLQSTHSVASQLIIDWVGFNNKSFIPKCDVPPRTTCTHINSINTRNPLVNVAHLALNPLLETAVHLDGLDVGDGVSGGRASRPVRVAVAPDVPETVGGLSGNLYSS